VAEFSVRCPEMVRKFVNRKYYYNIIEKSHFEHIVKYSNDIQIKRTSFIINDWIFDVSDNQTQIFSFENELLLSLPKEILPEYVDLKKIKTLLLFS
jgi:hypothetical protein